MKKKLIVLSSSILSFMPLMALAQQNVSCASLTDRYNIQGVICKIGDILNIIIPILVVLGVVYFVWGVVTYVISNDEEAKKAGRDRMIYGIIGLVVIIAMWGLVSIVTNTFNVGGYAQPKLPDITY